MSTDTIDREQVVNVNELNIAQAEQLTEQISKKLLEVTDKAIAKANKMLNVYGLEAKMQIVIVKKESQED